MYQNLKTGKCPGADQILNESIKSTKNIFLPVYEKLFKSVFDTGILPSTWLKGTIRPIYENMSMFKMLKILDQSLA